MANSIEVEVKLGLQSATGTIDRLRQALKDSVNIDSSSFKSINKMLDDADRLSTRLKSNLGGAFKNSNSISRYAKDFQAMIDKITTAQDSFQYIGKKDLLFDENETQKIKDINAEITQLSASMKRYEANKIGQIFDDKSIESFNQVREAAASLHVELSKTTFENFGNKLTQKLTELGSQIEDTTTKITNLQNVANNTKLADVAAVTSDLFKATSQFSTSVLTDKGAQDTRKNLDQILEEAGLNKKQTNNNFNYSNVIRAGTSTAGLIEKETQAIEKAISEQITTLQEKQSSLQKAHDTINDIMNGKTITGDNGEKISTRTNEIKQNLISQLAQQFPNIDFGTQAPGESYRKYLERLLETFEREIQQLDPTVLKESLIKKLQESTKDLDTQQVFGSQENIRAFQQAIKDTFTPQGLDIDKIESLNLIFSKIKVSDNVASTINAIAQALANFKNNANTDAIAQATEELKKLQQEREKYSQVKTTTENAKIQAGEQYEKEKQRAQELIETLANLYNIKLQVVREKGNSSGFSEQEANNINNISAAIKNYGEQVKGLESKQKSLGNIQTAVNRWMGFWQVLNMTKSAINDMKQHIQELDSVMTQISVVTNFSQKDLWGQISTYSEIARQYGVAIKGVYEVSQIYYQQGLQQNDVMTLTTETLKMARIAGLDYATAADYMTTAIRGFKLEMTDAAHVTDVFSALAATTASSTEEIATAISKTAASAQAVGASFEATSAMMATMIATTRESATNIGTALKSVISRYGEMTSDPSKTVDSEGEEMSLNRVDAALQTVGITIHDTTGQFRDFDDVILELMEKWDSLDSLSQRYIATLMAGNRQQSRFLALVSNVDEYKKALETAMDSEGAGELQTLKTLDSIDAKIEKMKVTIQEFYTSSGIEELYKGILDSITNIVSAANSLPKAFQKIPVAAIAMGASIISAIKSAIQVILGEIQAGLEMMKGNTQSTMTGLISMMAQGGRQSGEAYRKEQEAAINGSTAGKYNLSKGAIIGGAVLRYAGAALSIAGASQTLQGMNAYGASLNEDQDQAAAKQVARGGILGILGSAASGAATGTMINPGWGTAIGAGLGLLKGVAENIASLTSASSMYNIELARQIELSQKRIDATKTEAAQAKGEENTLLKAYDKLIELQKHQYDSVEAMQEYTEYMNQLGESYPKFIQSIGSNGDVLINVTALEEALADARKASAEATLAAAKAEMTGADLNKQAYEKLQTNVNSLKEFDIDTLRFASGRAMKYAQQGYQPNAQLIAVYNERYGTNLPIDQRQGHDNIENYNTIMSHSADFMQYWNELAAEGNESILNYSRQQLKSVIENFNGQHQDLDIAKQLGFDDTDGLIKSINSYSDFLGTLDKIDNIASQYIDHASEVLDNVGKAVKRAEISKKVQDSLTELQKSDKKSDREQGRKLQDYASLLSFLFDVEPSDEELKKAEQLILNNEQDATRLTNIDYSKIRSFKDIELGAFEEYRERFKQDYYEYRENLMNGFTSQLESLEGNLDKQLFQKLVYGGQNGGLVNELIPQMREHLSEYSSLLQSELPALADNYRQNLETFYTNISSLSLDQQLNISSILSNIDFTDSESLLSAASTLEGMGPQYKDLAKSLTDAADRFIGNAQLILTQAAEAIIGATTAVETAFDNQKKVFKKSEVLKNAEELLANYTGPEKYNWDDLYTYDKDLGGYFENENAFMVRIFNARQTAQKQVDKAKRSIKLESSIVQAGRDRYYSLDTYGQFDEDDWKLDTNKVDFSKATGLSGLDLDAAWAWLQQAVVDFNDQLDTGEQDFSKYLTKRVRDDQKELNKAEQEIIDLYQNMSQQELDNFDYSKIVSGQATVQSKSQLQSLLTQAIDPTKFKLDQDRFNEAYATLITGDLDSWNTYIDELNTKTGLNIAHANKGQANRARFESLINLYQKIASGDVIWDALTEQEQILLNSVDGVNLVEGASAAQVGAAADNVWSAIIKLIEAGAGTLNEVADTIAGKADKAFKDSNAGKQYNLLTSYKDGFTSQEAQELGLLNNDGTLKTEFTSYLERGSNGNWVVAAGQDAASVIEILAQLLSISIDKTTDEYKNAIKEGINQAITDANAADIGKQATSALQSLVSGKLGDRIDVSELASVAGDIYEITSEYLRDELIMSLDPEEYDAEYKKALKAAQTDITSKRNKAIQSVISGATFDTATAELFVSSFGIDPSTITDMAQWMGHFGFEWDGYLQQFKATADTIELLRSRIAEAAEQGASNETLNTLRAQVDQIDQQKQIDTSAAYSAIVSNYQSLGTDAITNFANAIGMGYERVIETFNLTRNGDGTYKLDLAKLSEILASGKDAVGEATYNAMLETVAGIQDNILSSITGAASFVYQGTNSTADMQKFINELNTLTGSNLGIEDAFSYDTILNTFTLNANAMKRYADAQKAELTKLGLSGEAIDEYIKDQTVTLMQQNMDIESFLNAQGANAKSREASKLATQIVDWMRADGSKLTDEALLTMAEQWINQIEQGGTLAVEAIKAIKGENATASELEAAFNNSSIAKLRTAAGELTKGVGETVTGYTKNIMQAAGFGLAELDDGTAVITSVGDMVQAYANLYAAMKEATGRTTSDLNNAYAKVLTAADQKNIDTLETLENAAGITYEAFGEILAKYGGTISSSLENVLKHPGDFGIESTGFGKVRITDFDRFASFMKFDINSPEYAEAYNSWVDSMIELQNQPVTIMQNAADQLKGLTEAKAGQKLNVSYLDRQMKGALQAVVEENGSTLINGILTIGDTTDIPSLVTDIINEAAAAGQMIPEQLAELTDAVSNMIKSIADLIKGGISGTLNNADATKLANWAQKQGIQINFDKTTAGLKLAENSAISLYNKLKEIDAIQAKLVFDDLSESLQANNENFKSITSILNHIESIRNGTYAADEKVSNARLEQYEAELEIAQEILLARSTSADDSFNFMSNDIPAAQNNPLNYYKNWSEAIKTLNTAMKTSARDSSGKTHKGLIDYTDFYNIVNEVNNLAGMMGQAVTVGYDINKDAIQLDGSMESAAALIEKGAKALTTTDTGDIAVSLGDIGVSFQAGSSDMSAGIQSGLKEMADGQVEMLDGLIALLETIVAMEGLSDVAGEDMNLDLGDIFNVETGDLEKGYTEFAADFENYRQKLIKLIGDDPSFGRTLDQTKLVWQGQIKSVKDLLLDGFEDTFGKDGASAEEAKKYQTIMNSFMQAAISGNYNLDDIFQSVKTEFTKAGLDLKDLFFELTDDEGKIVRLLSFEGENQINIDFTDQNARKAVAEAMNRPEYLNDEELYRAEVTKAFEAYHNDENLTFEQKVNYRILLTLANGEVKIKDDSKKYGKNKFTGYYNGQQFTGSKEEIQRKIGEAAVHSDEGFNFETIVSDAGETSINYSQTISGMKIDVTFNENNEPVYNYNGGTYTLDELKVVLAKAGKLTEAGIYVDGETTIEVHVTEDGTINYSHQIAEGTDEWIYQGANFNSYDDMMRYAQLRTQYRSGNNSDKVEGENDSFTETITISDSAKVILRRNVDGNLEEEYYIDDVQIGSKEAFDAYVKASAMTGAKTEYIDETGNWQVTYIQNDAKITVEVAAEGTVEYTAVIGDHTITATSESELSVGIAAISQYEGGTLPPAGEPIRFTIDNKEIIVTVDANGKVQVKGTDNEELKKAVEESYKEKYGKTEVDLSDQITLGITNALPQITEALKTLDGTQPTGLASWSDAVAKIGAAADATATAVNSLIGALSRLGKLGAPTPTPQGPTVPENFEPTTTPQFVADMGMDTGEFASIAAEDANAFTSTFASTIDTGEPKIQDATGSIRTHVEELGTAVNAIFGDINQTIASIQQHVSITGEVTLETPVGGASTASGIRDENGNITFNATVKTTTDATEVAETVAKVTAIANVITKTDPTEVINTITSLNVPTVEVPVQGRYIGTTDLPEGFSTTVSGGGNQATGNFGPADARGTLMGELGPELVVQDGRYFVAGQNGAEFVDLQDDAIVFNHLQTEQLLKKGMSSTRGRAVTNERTAVAFAQGNVNGGPAMASASAALAALKQLRSMWASLASASVQDLAGAGGGGGGGGGDKDMAAYIKELEKWYNWLQKIAELEDKINYQEQLRSTISSSQRKNGSAYYSSLKDTLKNLQEQVKTEQSLIDAQQKYFDKRRKELNTNGPFNSLYTFDENGQLKYKKGALNKLSKLNETDKYGKPKMSSEQQYDYIVNTLGIDEQYLLTTASGEKIDKEQEGWQATAVQAFWDKMDADKEEMQSLHDSINEHSEALLAAQEQQNEILQEMRDNQLAVEQNVYDAIVDSRERAIEDAEAMRDALEESTTKFIDGLSSALDKERSMYEMQQSQTDLDQKRRRLAILQRTGGSNSEIASLQSDIASSERDLYFDKQQEQIDLIQEASDKQIEKLDQQIELDKELLEYQKAHGLLWSEVADIMKMDSAAITDFITSNNSEWWAKSPVQSAQDLQDAIFQTDQWVEFRDDQNSFFQNIIDTIYNTTTNAAPDNPTSTADSTTQLDGNDDNNENTKTEYKPIKGNDKQHKKITKTKTKKGGWKTTKTEKEDHKFDKSGVCKKCGYKKKKTNDDGDKPTGSGNGSGGTGGNI